MEDLLHRLRQFDAIRDSGDGKDIVRCADLQAISPAYSDETVFSLLEPSLADALRARGLRRLYRHQADAIEAGVSGKNVVLQAPTASGKSLAFQVPMLNTLISDEDRRALMIYPTKALSLDQRDQLMQLTDHLPGRNIQSWWYDGDVSTEERKAIRQNPFEILFTNPDMLHRSFLGHSDLWTSFFRGLRWIVVDEIHEYRGYFGSNVSMILRRLLHHLASLGIRPQLFLSSATCANAREHAENLTGAEFEEVNAAASMRPRRSFFFIQPDIPDFQYWEILQLRTVMAGLACLQSGHSVLAFCPTRKFAEHCHRTAMREVARLKEEGRDDGLDPDAIKVFRAGLRADDRHKIQEGLKRGVVRLVFTTTALELGIDIGGLDGVILAGFPDSMMSAWQRIGRAGRDWKSDAFVLYYPRNNPLDRFYAANLPAFLDKPLDDLVINAENEDVIERHVPCLLYETPQLGESSPVLGKALLEAAQAKVRSGARVVRTGRYRPHFRVDVRGGGAGMYALERGSEVVGSISAHHQFREAYLRAIYMHGGSTYRVEEVAQGGDGGKIKLSDADPHLRTNPSLFTTLTQQDIFDGFSWTAGPFTVEAYYGKVSILERLVGVEEVDERTGEVRDKWTPELQPSQFTNAHAFWLRGKTALSPEWDFLALQHILRVGVSFAIPIDGHDAFPYADGKDQVTYLVENYRGGIGIARKVLERWRTLLRKGMEVADRCKCRRGCPNCIVPPRATEELDKRGGTAFATALLAASDGPASARFSGGLWVPVAD